MRYDIKAFLCVAFCLLSANPQDRCSGGSSKTGSTCYETVMSTKKSSGHTKSSSAVQFT